MFRYRFTPRRAAGVVVRSLPLLAAWGVVGASARPILDAPLVVTQVPREARARAGKAGQDIFARAWFERARLVVVSPSGQPRVLAEGFAAACDPNVSFDAKTVLFAGKKQASDSWRIWEIGVDGQGLRPLSPENMEARSPLYVSTLFTLESPQPWFTALFVARVPAVSETGRPWFWSLYNVKLDGGELRRLTYSPGHSYDPVQMWDGRVVYSSERFLSTAGEGPARVGLFAIHIEGADAERYGGELGGPVQHMACSLEQDRMVFVEPSKEAWDGAGQLACLDERRPHVTYERLTDDSKYRYLYPAAWRGKALVVSRRPTSRSGTAGVFGFDLETRQADVLYDSAEFDDVQAQVLQPRKRPDGHSTVVDGNFKTGTLYGLNCFETEPGLAPHLTPGTVRRIRLIEGVIQGSPTNNPSPTVPQWRDPASPFVPKRLVGEAPVEPDGSFNVEVPADTPMKLQVLDERGLALATCNWIWVKPKETRGCIGCHEDPERIPQNEYAQALRRPANRLTLEPMQRRTLSFREDIAPIVVKHCAAAECHGGKSAGLRLPGTGGDWSEDQVQKAFATLLAGKKRGDTSGGKYVVPGVARLSPLVWNLMGTNTSRPWDITSTTKAGRGGNTSPMPPHKAQPLSTEQLTTIVQWIDMGAPYATPDGMRPDKTTQISTLP